MKRSILVLLLVWTIVATCLPAASPAFAAPANQRGTPLPPTSTPASTDVQAIMSRMSPVDRVGQLFVVSYQGDDLSDNSDIATLVRDYRVGGVVLLPDNENFRTTPVTGTVAGQTQPANTALQIARSANRLQSLAFSTARPIPGFDTGTQTPIPTTTAAAGGRESDGLPDSGTGGGSQVRGTPSPTPPAAVQRATGPGTPLLIGLDWQGDDSSTFSAQSGFTPLPSAMSIGATWTVELSERAGQTLGQEMQAVGVNLLLGPPLDVLDAPRPGGSGDLRTRSFGGDPFWVGQMGQAFIRGVANGSGGGVVTAANHFPGQGGSDRLPDDEVATVQKSVEQLRQIELAPFAAVASSRNLTAPGVTAALMTSHIRYRGFQGNIRQLTPPISLAPQLQDLMALREFADWRAGGGVLMSDALGVPALRRYYDPALQKFPHRQVAQDAFLAGNDLLFLSRFALTDNWSDQFLAIKETILFFQSKYQGDSQFRARVDQAVERILRMKLRASRGSFTPEQAQRDLSRLDQRIGQSYAVPNSIARAALTLMYPGREELADRLPSAPLPDDNILIFTDSREVSRCPSCRPAPLIATDALQSIIMRLYGPTGTGQVAPEHLTSMTFADLTRALNSTEGDPPVERAINNAEWIIFAQLDLAVERYPDSLALRTFLARRSDKLRDKRLVVMAFDAPYYLDTTEVSKLTAYFGIYSRTGPFLESAARALFREFTPLGSPPVSVSGINYRLINQVEPARGQVIPIGPVGGLASVSGKPASIQVGTTLDLETGIIMDRNGHPVPDGTPVEFHMRYPTEALQLAPVLETTTGGRARTRISLDRAGELWITAQSGDARESTRIVLKIGGDAPGTIATVLPSATTAVTVAPTATPTATPTPEPTPAPAVESTPPPPAPRVTLPAFLYAFAGVLVAGGGAFAMRRRRDDGSDASGPAKDSRAAAAALWAAMLGWIAYLLYSFGWLPGATEAQAAGRSWAAGAVALFGGCLVLLWNIIGPSGTQDKRSRG